MADVFRHRKEFHKPRYFPVASATVIEVGDLLWWDSSTNTVKPASDFTYGASLEATQRAFKAKFVGVAMDRSRSGDTTDVQVNAAGIVEFVCASATFDIGDLIGVDDNAGGDTLTDQQVIAVTDPSLALGKVNKREGSAVTTIEFELFPVAFHGEPRNPVMVWEHTITAGEDTAGYIDFDTGWGAAPGAILVQVRNGSTNRNESHDFEITKRTGDNLGQIRVADGYSNALDADDILTVTAFKYAGS